MKPIKLKSIIYLCNFTSTSFYNALLFHEFINFYKKRAHSTSHFHFSWFFINLCREGPLWILLISCYIPMWIEKVRLAVLTENGNHKALYLKYQNRKRGMKFYLVGLIQPAIVQRCPWLDEKDWRWWCYFNTSHQIFKNFTIVVLKM